MQKFGDLKLTDILVNRNFTKTILHDDIDIKPLDIIATSHHPHFCDKSLFEIFISKKKFLQFFSKNEHFNKEYFFSNINQIDPLEAITYYCINDIRGKKKYIIRHGNHRSIIAYFLQLLDNSYRLKGVNVTEFVIDWDRVEQKMRAENKYFDYEKLESYFN
ncbi:MAG: hypothetical protein J0647_01565 [Campylobacteraceae bacterium]|nr:hypothetical protein [Campylobacteraceae bacterium]